MSKHTVVWLDHQEARIFNIDPDAFDESVVHAPAHHVHRHPKGATEARTHRDDATHFFKDVAKALDAAHEVLLVGPGTAKLQFLRYAQKNEHKLESKIVGLETVDHPTDKQLVAHAKHYFVGADRMR
jgi:stalled ribosome rescue protein Dom34